MRYLALATDYDGTLATHGALDEPTRAALRRFKESGRKLIMVTGRELDELLEVAGDVEVFDRIVAENGAVIYEPATKEARTTCQPPPPEFADELRKRGAERLAVGRVIVATVEPHQDTVLEIIKEQGLELQVIFNKGAVMVLPSGVNKATGLKSALEELGLSPHNVVSIGDAENDHALLGSCECGVAVANALDSLKTKADLVTPSTHGAGVAELVDMIVSADLAELAPKLSRYNLEIGRANDKVYEVDAYATTILVCGTSGSGKSTVTHGLLERLAAAHYQFAIIDPEGDYRELDIAVVLGSTKRAPLVDEAIDVMRDPNANCVVNMLGIALDHRPDAFTKLATSFAEMRTRVGRPHWIIIDEAHHMLPATSPSTETTSLVPDHGAVYITVHPGSVSKAVLDTVTVLLALGDNPVKTVQEMCTAAGQSLPKVPDIDSLPTGKALLWRLGDPEAIIIDIAPPSGERTRHSRKYVEGNLGPDRAFFFRGPDNKLNLKAHNLLLFVQIGDGVDDDTWQFHRGRGDYSTWMRSQIKDNQLADEIEAIEKGPLTPADARGAMRAVIAERYTLPADVPSGVVDEA